jgi:hypothetical protein
VANLVSGELCSVTAVLRRFTKHGATLIVVQRTGPFQGRVALRKPHKFELQFPYRRFDDFKGLKWICTLCNKLRMQPGG